MDQNHRLLRASLIFIASTAIIIVGIQPIFIGLLTERIPLSISQQGWIISIEMAGTVAGTVLCRSLGKFLSGRHLCLIAASLGLLLNLLSATAEHLPLLLGYRLVTGLSAGLLYSYAVNGLGRLAGQDRSFGIMLFIQTAIFSLFAATLPMLAEQFGPQFALGSIGGWFLLIGLASLNIPSLLEPAPGPITAGAEQTGSAVIGRFSLVGMLFLQISIFCVWGFIDQIARDQGISAVEIGWAFGLGVLGGLPGAALPSLLGSRVRRGAMIGIGSLMVLVSLILFSSYSRSANELFLAVFLMNFGWILALSYYMSSVATNDPKGTLTPLVSITQASAATLAPALIALLPLGTDKQFIFLASAIALITGFTMKCAAGIAHRRSTTRAKPTA